MYWDSRKPKNFPRGPPWYPIAGCAVALEMKRRQNGMLWQAINEFAKEYDTEKSGVVGFKVGKDRLVRSDKILTSLTFI